MPNAPKKSLYVFLCCIMGALLFLILHRILVFSYLALLNYDYDMFNFGLSYFNFLVWDYFTLILALLAGGWYGVWLGIYWYEAVYQESDHAGFIGHLISRYWPTKPGAYNLKTRIAAASKKVEGDLWQLEDLAKKATTIPPTAMPKRRVARRSDKI